MSSITPSRRGLLAASAWSVPAVVVASSAPAFATTTSVPAACVEADYLYNWVGSTWTYTSNNSKVVAGSGAGVGFGYASVVSTLPQGARHDPVKVTLTNNFSGNTVGLVNDAGKNMVVPAHVVGGLDHRGLELYQGISTSVARKKPEDRPKDHQIIEVTFDRAVSGLSFTITDIDFNTNQYADRVELSGSYTAKRAQEGKTHTVSGAGTPNDPWRGQAGGNIDHVTDGRGNVTVTFKEPVRSFTLKFWSAEGGRTTVWGQDNYVNSRGAQAIFLSNFSFRASTC